MSLREYQIEGVSFLASNVAALLADEMGLGKTIQCIVAIEYLKSNNIINKILVVSPASLCHNWEVEFNRWASKLSVKRLSGSAENRQAYYRFPFTILIASYEHIRSDAEFIYKECEYDLVILDEAQRIKNIDSATATACRQIKRQRSWALTGTPLENRPDDLISIFAFLTPEKNYSGLTKNEIHKSIYPHFLRRKKGDVLREIPPIITQDLSLDMKDGQRNTYDDIWHNAKGKILIHPEKMTFINLLAMITKLKQICNYDAMTGESCKIDALLDIVNGLQERGDKILIFSQYVQSLHQIKAHLTENNASIFHGGLSADEKLTVQNKFNQEPGPSVLLVSLKAGGVGLNLNSASTVILFDRWWNPAVEDQAIQRAHRFGRQKPLHVIRFLVKDSIEERIDDILRIKKIVFDEYIENATSAKAIPLTQEDLISLFTPKSLKETYYN